MGYGMHHGLFQLDFTAIVFGNFTRHCIATVGSDLLHASLVFATFRILFRVVRMVWGGILSSRPTNSQATPWAGISRVSE